LKIVTEESQANTVKQDNRKKAISSYSSKCWISKKQQLVNSLRYQLCTC